MSGIRLDVPEDQERKLRALAQLRAMRVRNEKRFAEHPWPFFEEAIFTSDPFAHGAQGGGIHKYPAHNPAMRDPTPGCTCKRGGCENYLEHVVNMWFKYPRTLWPKSRRLLTSWTMIGCHVWLARYRPGQVVAFVSRKQGQNEDEGAAELVKRARFIEGHYPIEIQPREIKATWCRIYYPHNDSVIVGLAQGADQMRQLAVNAWFGDEFAFWEQAGSTYSASLPSLEGGGRCALVSTPNPGFMETLVGDSWNVGTG